MEQITEQVRPRKKTVKKKRGRGRPKGSGVKPRTPRRPLPPLPEPPRDTAYGEEANNDMPEDMPEEDGNVEDSSLEELGLVPDEAGDPTYDVKHQDFNAWMLKLAPIVERNPDDYWFRIIRRYPKIDPINGVSLEGTVERKINVPFSEEWMCQRFPDGGRFDVSLIGPWKSGRGKGVSLGQIHRTFRGVRIARNDIPTEEAIPPPTFDVRSRKQIADDDADDDDHMETMDRPDSFTERLAGRYLQDVDHTKAQLARMEQQRRIPPPPAKSNGMEKIVEQLLAATLRPKAENGTSSEERQRLYDLVNSLKDNHRQELGDRLDKASSDSETRVRDMRESYEKLLGEARTRGDSELDRMRTAFIDRYDALKDRFDDTKEELRSSRSSVTTLQQQLAESRHESTMAQSELKATQSSKASELKAAVLEAKIEAEKDARSREPKSKDALEDLTSSLTKAISFKDKLVNAFGDKDAGPEPKKSRLEQWGDIAAKIAGSKDVQETVQGALKTTIEAIQGASKKRAAQATAASGPSTKAIIDASVKTTMIEPPPIEPPVTDEHPRVVAVQNPESETTLVMPDDATIAAAANDMLDAIEDSSSLDTPVEEAAEEMLIQLEGMLPFGREMIVAQLKDATWKDVLESVDMDESRLTDEAKGYLDRMIQHAVK